jgi:hypothetical protein
MFVGDIGRTLELPCNDWCRFGDGNSPRTATASWSQPRCAMNRSASRLLHLTLASALGAAASGCAGPTMAEPGAPVPAAATDMQTILAAVRADAVATWQLGDASTLTAEVQSVTWPDGSMGCPQPGRMYTQALVPGWRIVLREGGRERIYHASARGRWLPCPAGRAVGPLIGSPAS